MDIDWGGRTLETAELSINYARGGKGPAVITGEAEGPNMRGNVREQIKEEMAAKGSEPADPLVIETLPKSHRENAQDYFDRLREGDQ